MNETRVQRVDLSSVIIDAQILFEITLVEFTDGSVVDSFENLSDQEKQAAKLEKVLNVGLILHKAGMELFKKNAVHAAREKFVKALHLMERLDRVQNEEESIKYDKFVLKLLINLAVCANKLGESAKACIYCKRALAIDQLNAKAHYHFGKALLNLSDFLEAKNHLKTAQCQEPHNNDINKELVKLEEKQSLYDIQEKKLMMRMMKHCRLHANPEILNEESKESKDQLQTVREHLLKFSKDSNQELVEFPVTLNASECELIKEEAENLNLTFRIVRGTLGSADHISLSKL